MQILQFKFLQFKSFGLKTGLTFKSHVFGLHKTYKPANALNQTKNRFLEGFFMWDVFKITKTPKDIYKHPYLWAFNQLSLDFTCIALRRAEHYKRCFRAIMLLLLIMHVLLRHKWFFG